MPTLNHPLPILNHPYLRVYSADVPEADRGSAAVIGHALLGPRPLSDLDRHRRDLLVDCLVVVREACSRHMTCGKCGAILGIDRGALVFSGEAGMASLCVPCGTAFLDRAAARAPKSPLLVRYARTLGPMAYFGAALFGPNDSNNNLNQTEL